MKVYTGEQIVSLLNRIRMPDDGIMDTDVSLINLRDAIDQRLWTAFRQMVPIHAETELQTIKGVGRGPEFVKEITHLINEIHGSDFKITLTLEPKGFYEESKETPKHIMD